MNIRTTEINSPPNLYPGFVYFSLRALVPGTRVPCEVRLETVNPRDNSTHLMSVLSPGQEVLGSWAQAVLDEGLNIAYVSVDDLEDLQKYLHQSTREAFARGDLAPEEGHLLVYENALTSIKAAILDPGNGRRLSQGVATVRELIDFIWNDDTARDGLLAVMSEDRELFSHSLNVCLFGVGFARVMGWPRQEVESLGQALFFHDLGLAALGDKLNNGSAPAEGKGNGEYRRHPRLSRDFLRNVPGINDQALETVYCHHEYLDGSGFPRGLGAGGLTTPARLAAIVDCYVADTSGYLRSGKLKPFDALKKMRGEMRDQLDQSLLEEFVRFLGRT